MRQRSGLVEFAVISLLCASLGPVAHASVEVSVTNLVSDDATLAPKVLDPALVNPWGVSFSPTSPFWISNNGSGNSTLYSVNPTTQATTKLGLTVTIPGNGSVTGQVFNSAGASAFNGDTFLFASEDGTVSGWRNALGTNAESLATASPDNLYKGVALGSIGANGYLYAANFHTGAIDVYKGNAAAPSLAGAFVDPTLPAGYAPFNVRNINGTLYVTYARQGAGNDEQAGPGLGFVDRFDLNGNFLGRVAGGGTLDAPWGLAIAPPSFGSLAGALLVGNFGDGRISAFDAASGSFLGQLLDETAAPLEIDGLWALTTGNNGNAGSSDRLYFTAGPGDESHGLFGVLAFAAETGGTAPEIDTLALLGVGLASLAGSRRRRRQ